MSISLINQEISICFPHSLKLGASCLIIMYLTALEQYIKLVCRLVVDGGEENARLLPCAEAEQEVISLMDDFIVKHQIHAV